MKILLDHQTFSIQKFGGISRYFSEIMQYFHNQKISFDLSLLYSENKNLIGRSYFNNKNELGEQLIPDPLDWLFGGAFPGKRRLYNFFYKGRFRSGEIFDLNREETIRRLQTNQYTVFHPTYYHDYYLAIVKEKKIPVVLTAYDMIHELFPQFFPLTDFEYATKAKTILAADKLIAISDSTKNDLINLLDLQPNKIEVIHLASSLKYKKEEDINIGNSYILYVGDRSRYKNFIPFIKSITPLLKKHNLKLLCAGANPFYWKENLHFYKLGISEHIDHVSIQGDSHLASLYKHALCFVFPSLYEGFGIPLLEAMNIGCPVVCSNTSSFPEVAGEAAEYFDPKSPESMYSSVQKLIESESLRKDLSKKGILRSQKFSWEQTAKKHIELYESLS